MLVQMIDVILAWLIAEDDGARNRIQEIFADRDEDLSLIKATLEGIPPKPHLQVSFQQLIHADDLLEQARIITEGENTDEDIDFMMKDILSTLIQFL
jgi:hypothetical protein